MTEEMRQEIRRMLSDRRTTAQLWLLELAPLVSDRLIVSACSLARHINGSGLARTHFDGPNQTTASTKYDPNSFSGPIFLPTFPGLATPSLPVTR